MIKYADLSRKPVISFASQLDGNVLTQAAQIADLPFIHQHVALMPDAHAGKGSSVGTVIPTIDAVIPAAVGVDIGCGMIAVRTNVTRSHINSNSRPLSTLREMVEGCIPLSPGNYNEDVHRYWHTISRVSVLEALAEEREVDLSHSPNWPEQLGTLGGGNHFIELCSDQNDDIWLFLHSGSRGVGNKIAQKHIKIAQKLMKKWWIELPDPDLSYLPQSTPEFGAYISELNWAQKFAQYNRDEMMDRYMNAFMCWLDPANIHAVELERINTHHNYTVREHHMGRDVWLTRKGAICAREGERGLIPGSMGTGSFVVTGKGNPVSFNSAPHGAGRRFSRNKAKELYTEADLADRMKGIEYRHGADWIDEIPDAYKDITQVMKDADSLVSIDYELHQLMNVKGT